MPLLLLNPWGLLALAGLPVILAIHLLRRQSREVRASTLFLLDKIPTSKEGGRRLQNLRQTLPLWLQLAAVCVLALMLAQPRWIDQASQAQIAIVMDSSASMGAFREKALQTLDKLMTAQSRQAVTVDWTILSSDGSRLAAGSKREEILKKVTENWQPTLRHHDPTDALRIASSTIRSEENPVIYLTDHTSETDRPDIQWIACGEPLDNAAFVGCTVQDDKWSALVRNFSPRDRTIRWRIKGEESPWQELALKAGSLATLEGSFAANSDRIALELEPDVLTIDNLLPIVKPQPKILNLALSTSDENTLGQRISRLAEPVTRDPSQPTDITIATYDPLSPSLPSGNAIIFVQDPAASQKPLTAPLVTQNTPLMTDLNWQGLRVRNTLGLPFKTTDTPLLWQGTRPLIFLRSTPEGRQLILNFDLTTSNLSQLPAFPILLHRFLEEIRKTKPTFEARNLDTNQPLTLPGHGKLTTPTTPDFLTIPSPQNTPLLTASAQFLDPAESDLQRSGTSTTSTTDFNKIEKHQINAVAIDLILSSLLLGLLLVNWNLTSQGSSRNHPMGGIKGI